MVGLIYLRKGHQSDAIARMENAFERCTWNAHWRRDLIQAYEMSGQPEKARALRGRGAGREQGGAAQPYLGSDVVGETEW
ncbi:hypothetical protein D3C71_2165830 [compost metagenome]